MWVLGKYFSYFSNKTCCGYSLEVPHKGASNEYPPDRFSWRNKENIRGIVKEDYLDNYWIIFSSSP